MPTRKPKCALLGEVDISSLIGQVVADVGQGGNWTIGSSMEKKYRTIRHLLNGHGSRLWTLEYGASVHVDRGLSTWTFGVTSDGDKLRIRSTGANAEAFTVAANTSYGITSTLTASEVVVSGGDNYWEAVAQGEWSRGRIDDPHITITRTGSATDFTVPRAALSWSDSVIHLLRRRGTISDADDNYNGKTLEDDDATFSQQNDEIYWGIGSDGLVWRAYQASLGDNDISFPDTTAGNAFKEMLGFDTNEPTHTTVDGVRYCVGDRPPPSVLFPDTSLRRWLPGRVNRAGVSVSAGGVVSGIVSGQNRPWRCSVYYYSPLTVNDMERHIFRDGGWLDHCPPGYPVDVCPELGDPRRGTDSFSQGYSELYNPYDSGRRGRRVCKIQEGTGDLMADYGDVAVEHRGQIDLRVVEDPSF